MQTRSLLRNSLILTALLFASLVSNAQYKKELSLSNFTKLDFSSAFSLEVTKGSSFKVSVDAERQEDLDDLDVKVSGSTLVAKYKSGIGWRKNRKNVHFTVVMPNLKAVDLSGATRSKIAGFNDLEELTLKLSGASNSDISLSADKVTMDVSGASKLKMTGKASKLNLDASGASDINCYGFTARDADVDASGASSVKISAQQTLNVEASGASSVRYQGNPSLRKSSSGASSVRAD